MTAVVPSFGRTPNVTASSRVKPYRPKPMIYGMASENNLSKLCARCHAEWQGSEHTIMKQNFLGKNLLVGMVCVLLGLGATPASGQPSERGFAGGSESSRAELAVLAHTGGVIESPSALTRIIGGQNASILDFPWQVALIRAPASNAYYQQFCGGSIIDRWWVVTAAHCVDDLSARGLHVAYGIDFLPLGRVNLQSVRTIIEHPEYDGRTNENDIALLRLTRPLTFSPSVSTVGLPGEEQTGFNGVITGWGNMSTSGSDFPQRLKAAEVSHVSDIDCAATYGSDFDSASMLCAGHPLFQYDTCQGDSGGPLVTLVSGQWTLIGITSWGNGCALAPYPGIYAKVTAFEPWIRSTTGILARFNETKTPIVSGNAVLGQTLTAGFGPGAYWDPVPDRYAYQWLVNGKPIKRATGSTYVVGKKEVGKRISVRVAGVKSGYVTATETSSSTDVVLTGFPFTSTEVPTISGDAVLGETLTASVEAWDPVPDRYAYQWLVNGKPIKRATGSTYVVGKKEVGKRISVRVAGVKSGYVTATETSLQTSRASR